MIVELALSAEDLCCRAIHQDPASKNKGKRKAKSKASAKAKAQAEPEPALPPTCSPFKDKPNVDGMSAGTSCTDMSRANPQSFGLVSLGPQGLVQAQDRLIKSS